MAEATAAEREQRLSAWVEAEGLPTQVQRLSEEILTEIRTQRGHERSASDGLGQ